MYEAHFGLDKRVFHGNDAGNGVFSGPQSAKVIAGMKKAMATSDAAVTLTGPVGVGKSTVARRALEAVSGKSIVIRIGRAPLGPDEVLDQMLEELGAAGLANGTIRRITVFRGALKQLEDKGARVVVIVEDAVRAGEETLVEIEALTAADGGVSSGANVVLMGGESLRDMLKSPALARLAQRIRMRQRLEAFSVGETHGYLRHCLRESGGAFDEIFATGCADLLHDLSGGVARVINNLVESVLVTAAEQGVKPVSHELIRLVANEEYGLESDLDMDTLAAAPAVDPQPDAIPAAATAAAVAAAGPPSAPSGSTEPPDGIPELTPVVEADDEPLAEQSVPETAPRLDDLPRLEPEPDSMPEAVDIPQLDADRDEPTAADIPELATAGVHPDIPRLEPDTGIDGPGPEQPQSAPEDSAAAAGADIPQLDPDPPAAAETPNDAAGDFDIPELIQDTQPELAALKETPAEINNPLPDLDELVPTLADDADAAGEPQAAARAAGAAAPDVPAWDRDPTQAELRPDIEALEQAMALARPPDQEEPDTTAGDTESKDDEPQEVVPEITLDASIQARVDAAEEDLRRRREAEARARAAAGADEEAEQAPEDPDEVRQQIAGAHATPAADSGAAAPPGDDARPPATDRGPADVPGGSSDDASDRGPADAPDGSSDAASEHDREELAKIAAGLAQARSIEDVDDQMAETLFGEEFSAIAAQVAANQPVDEPVELTLEATAESEPVPAQAAVNDDSSGENGDLKKEFEEVWGTSAVEVSIDSESGQRAGGLDLSASQRLATVRALNAGGPPARPARPAAAEPANGAGPKAPRPEPIEEQITTSMTQTLKALNVRKMQQEAQDEEDDDKKGGFFSRFRRS